MKTYRVFLVSNGTDYVDILAAGVNVSLVPGIVIFLDESGDIVGSAPSGLIFYKL